MVLQQFREPEHPVEKPVQKRSKAINTKKEKSVSQAMRTTTAGFQDDNQYMQMSVDDKEEELFQTENSDDDNDDEEIQKLDGIQELEPPQSDAESEPEEGQLVDQDSSRRPSTKKTPIAGRPKASPTVTEIDEEMQRRILDLHDRMEESGLTGSIELIEKLFDNKPGEDRPAKKKLKKAIRKGMPLPNDDQSNTQDGINPLESQSEETIYQNAVLKWTSSSSEEDGLDLSDESNLLTNLVLDETRAMSKPQEQVKEVPKSMPKVPKLGQPSTSKQPTANLDEQIADRVRLLEKSKASMYPLRGEYNNFNVLPKDTDQFKYIAQMDQDYVVVGSHIDEGMQEKIIKGMYIDFSKLIPKDKVLIEEDGRMELVIKNGKSFWIPASHTESVEINNFSKWEQAFRVYANIYTKGNPNRAAELIEYNHVIHSISLSFTWDNVYAYDKEFRLHMSRYPQRSWSIILQQAWSMKLRDRIARHDATPSHSNRYSNQSFTPNSSFKKGDECQRLNKGKCTKGRECRYEHRCSYCGKLGHGVIVCRKLIFDREHKPSSDQPGKREGARES